ncbi:MAG: hypothetical protein FWE49_06010, partial [Synergistaceae bacterium]|nr:hypothetical protein [Synergistaceae bacterium]
MKSNVGDKQRANELASCAIGREPTTNEWRSIKQKLRFAPSFFINRLVSPPKHTFAKRNNVELLFYYANWY